MFTSVSGPHQAFLLVSLMPQHTIGTDTLIDRVRARIASEMSGLKVSFQSGGIISNVLNAGLPAPIDLKLVGQNLDDLKDAALRISDAVAAVPGTSDVVIDRGWNIRSSSCPSTGPVLRTSA